MIRLRDVEFGYPGSDFVLRVAHFEVEQGATAALVGPSGCGKTTLLNLIAGILEPERGAIEVGETLVSDLSDGQRRAFRAANVGLVFQEFELLDYLDVTDNVLLTCSIGEGMKIDAAARERSALLLDQVDLHDKAKRRPQQLSQGERQRVAVCRALVTGPKLILADEPTGNLDPANKQRVVDTLVARSRASNATLLMVTHDRDLLTSFEQVIDFSSIAGTDSPSEPTS